MDRLARQSRDHRSCRHRHRHRLTGLAAAHSIPKWHCRRYEDVTTPENKSVDVRSVQERVYDRIRADIRQGVFTPGEPLTIRSLAARFGTSEMPVREAIKRLVAERALAQQSNRTFKIPAVTAERFGEVMPIRVMVEGRATELAANLADPALIDGLRRSNDAMKSSLARSDATGILQHNQAFHFKIYGACGNPTLIEIIEMLWLRSGPYLAALAAERRGIDAFFDAAESHSRIIAALQANDGGSAARSLRDDIETTAQWFWSKCHSSDTIDPGGESDAKQLMVPKRIVRSSRGRTGGGRDLPDVVR